MQSSQTPKLMPLAFAATGGRNAIPEASQLPGVINGASYADGFPPATRTAIVAGGKPPAGLDVNGILYEITQSLRWAHAGGRYAWNSTFANDANVGGYPNGATLMRADLTGFWLNTADNNATNPDATDGSAANWVPGYNYGITPITGLTNANMTLTPAQAAKSKITLAGTLTGNIQLIFPTWTKEWEVVNNTTGAFTITAKTAEGSGVALAAGQQKITGDGTNITQPAESVAAATIPQHASQLAQALAVSGPLCSLSYTNSTTLTLSRVRSGLVYSPGYGIVTVPSAGLTYTAAGLTSNTLYYVYLNPNGGNPSLSLSTTGHTTDATGVEVQTGNNSMVLVGMAYALSATTVESTVRSWSNDPGYSAISNLSSNSSSTSTTPTNVNTGMITPFLLWAKEIPYVSITAGMSVSSANFAVATVVAVDNAVVQGPVASSTPPAANEVLSAAVSIPVNGLAEGHHTTNMFGYVVGSVTGTWSGNSGTMSATVLSLCISPHK